MPAESLGRMAPRVLWALRVLLERLGVREHPEARVLLVLLDHKATKESLESLVPLAMSVLLALQERKVLPVQVSVMETQRETSSIGMDPYGKT
jgi:hypothetical protein